MHYNVKLTIPNPTQEDKRMKVEIVCNEDLFAQAELRGFEYAKEEYGTESTDVTAITRVKIADVVRANASELEPTKWFKVIIAQTFTDENTAKEKDLKYTMLVEGFDSSDADKRANDFMKQGLCDFRIVSIKETEIEAVIQ